MRCVVPLLACSLSICTPLNAQQPSREMAEVAAAYAAKITASAIFVSGRTLASVLNEELSPTRPLEALIRPLLQFDVDRQARSVTCRLGQAKATARMTAGVGCFLDRDGLQGDALEAARARGRVDVGASWPTADDWPVGERRAPAPATGIDQQRLSAALDAAFAEPDAGHKVHTRAVVILHQGRLVAERYADGYHQDMPLAGWSMTKTLTHALLGMRIAEGKFDLHAPPAVPAWRAPDDPRAAIKITDLLSMSAGIAWHENYDDPNSDALRMLFRSSNHAAVYAQQPAAVTPGEHFHYASGASNLLCELLRQTFADDELYWRYPLRLFRRLSMRTAVLETDPSGTFVGSSYCFASARDWARLGLLYAQDGVFAGKHVLPTDWVARAREPLEASNGRYGQQVWLNADPDGEGAKQSKWPDLPADIFSMDGHEGQYCVISPAAELVVVRLGCTKNGGFDLTGLLRRVHAALPE